LNQQFGSLGNERLSVAHCFFDRSMGIDKRFKVIQKTVI